MAKGKTIMLITALVSALCVIWAVCIKSYGMAVALALNAVFTVYVITKKLY